MWELPCLSGWVISMNEGLDFVVDHFSSARECAILHS